MVYELVSKTGEVIIKKNATSIDAAILLFSELKKLNTSALLRIYKVRAELKK